MLNLKKLLPFAMVGILFIYSCARQDMNNQDPLSSHTKLVLRQFNDSITVNRYNEEQVILTQIARPDFRPFIHPIVAPDGEGFLTEYSPGHHKHQTGLYWGFTRVNGRDYFHHPEGDYWKRVALDIIDTSGVSVSWQITYLLLNEDGEAILEETQTWSMREKAGKYILELEWQGEALTEITIGEYDYGGLFLRMPWRKGIKGEVVNAARQKNEQAEGKRAFWVDVGMQVPGREDLAHITIFDHPTNNGFPQTWRVDGQLGVGPVRARMGDWQISKGQIETIKHQFVVYTGELNDIEVNEFWEEYSDQVGETYSAASLWGIAQEEGRLAKFLSPQEAVDEMTMQEGFDVNVWASEPMITQPMAFCWDDKGRLWIAENRDYESRGYGFSNSGDSKILILEDTNGDGIADSKKVFLEGIPFPAGIAVGFDGLFLGAPPHLLFIPDKDGDDQADTENIEIRLTGWGIRDRHETINSLMWGPDGWLYGLEGFATPSKIRKPNADARLYRKGETFPEDLLNAEGVDVNGGVWRYHPTKDRFEVVAHGFSNPWGIDYDAKGQLFITACVIPHLFHVVPGGIYHRQGGRHFNPYVYSDIRTIVDHRHRSAHGGARIYQSDAFPKEHWGRLFMCNIHEHAVLSDILTPNRSSFIAKHGDDFLMANNAQWIGFSLEIGPDGGLYVLDWHDADICGKEVLNKETGRIFRIMPEKSQASTWENRYRDLQTFTDLQLAELQESPSAWHAKRAKVILQKRAYQGNILDAAIEKLFALFDHHPNINIRLRALWSLHVTNILDEQALARFLSDKDPHIRAWAIQLLCEDSAPSAPVLDQFVGLAQNDSSPIVRLYLSAALQRIHFNDRWPIALQLVKHSEDTEDPLIPKMLWFGIEPLVPTDPEQALQLANRSQISVITQYIARRLVDADKTEALIAGIEQFDRIRMDLLLGMEYGLQGRTDLVPPDGWEKLSKELQLSPSLKETVLSINQYYGDTEAAHSYLAILLDQNQEIDSRQQAIQQLAQSKWQGIIKHLPNLLQEAPLKKSVIRAISNFEDHHLGQLLLEHFDHFNPEEKTEALQTLSIRSNYGWLLTQAIQEGKIDRKEIPAYIARQLRRVVGNGFVEVWGPIDQLSGNKELAYAKYQQLLSEQAIQSANLSNGRKLFQNACGTCHQMFGEGGAIGPDLTGSNRANLNYILSNIIEPSSDIQDDYKMVIITTTDGRTYSGNIIAKNDRQITMRIIGQDALIIQRSNIQSEETSPYSLMPEGILNQMDDQEVIDLIGYLRTQEQVSLNTL